MSSDFKVTPIPVPAMLEREEIDRIVSDLQKRHKGKGIRAIAVAYIDDEGNTYSAVSDSTTISQLCYFTAVFQADVVRFLSK
jgi:hypothetical protein